MQNVEARGVSVIVPLPKLSCIVRCRFFWCMLTAATRDVRLAPALCCSMDIGRVLRARQFLSTVLCTEVALPCSHLLQELGQATIGGRPPKWRYQEVTTSLISFTTI